MSMTLHQALKSCNIVQMEELLMKDNSEVNVPDPQRGWSPLYKAVLYRDLKIVKLLLLNGADPNLPSTSGESPLHIAIENDLEKIVEALLENKADPNKLSNDGDSPLHIAAQKNYANLIAILIKYGADINLPNNQGKTAITISNELHHSASLLLLLEKKAESFEMPLPSTEKTESQEALKEITNIETKNKCRNFEEFLEKEKISNIVENLEKIDYFRKSQTNLNPLAEVLKEEEKEERREVEGRKEEEKEVVKIRKEGEKQEKMREEEEIRGREDEERRWVEEERRREKEEERREEEKSRMEKEGKRREEEERRREQEEKMSEEEREEKGIREEKVTFEKFEEALQKIQIEDMKKDITSNDIVFDINFDKKFEGNKTKEEKEQFPDKETPKQGSIPEKPIEAWLKDIHLVCLLQNFLDNSVFDNKSLINVLMNNTKNWDKYLISHFGIDKPGYRKRIIIKLKEDLGICQRSGLFKLKYSEKANLIFISISEWLRSLHFERFLVKFEESGYDDYESLVFQMSTSNCLTDQSLREEVGVEESKVREQILSQLNEDALKASQIKVPEDFEGEISFEINGKPPGTWQETCSIF